MAPRILIAEENDQVAAAVEALLRRHRMTTERARGGVETLRRIVAAPPDVLLLDLKLPRLCGLELLGELHQSPRTRVLPVVIGTGAYNTFSDVVKKERYDELLGSDKVGLGQKGDDRFQAQVQFQSGNVFIEMGEWESAKKALQDACNIDPNSGAYLAHLA